MKSGAIFSLVGKALLLTVLGTVGVFTGVHSQSYLGAYERASEQWGVDWASAAESLEEAEHLAKTDEGIYDPDYLTILNDLGIAYFESGELENSLETFDQLVVLYDDLEGNRGIDYWTARLNQARILRIHDPEESLRKFKLLLSATYAPVRVSALQGAYDILQEKSDTEGALQLLSSVNNTETADLVLLANRLLIIDYHRRSAQFYLMDSLLTAYDEAIPEDADPAILQTAHMGILEQQGLYWMETGEFHRAEKAFKDLLSYKEYLGLPETENTVTFNNLAKLYAENGLFNLAQEHIELALTHCVYGCTSIMQNQAAIYANTGYLSKAQEVFDAIYTTHGFKTLKEELSFHLNYLTAGAARMSVTERSFQRALEIMEEHQGDIPRMLQISYFEIVGRVYLKTGELAASISHLSEAFSLQKQALGEHSFQLLSVENYLGVAYLLNNEIEKSIELLTKANDAERRFIKYIYPLLSRSEQMMFLSKLKRDLHLTYSAILKYGETNQQLLEIMVEGQLIFKGLTLDVKRYGKIELDSSNHQLMEVYSEYYEARKLLADKYVGLYKMSKADEIQKIEAKISELESSIMRLNPANNNLVRLPDAKQLSQSLSAEEALIEFVRLPLVSFGEGVEGRVNYLALVLKKDQPIDLVRIPDGDFIENQQVKYYLNSIRFESVDSLSYDKFWKPIKPVLDGITTHYLVLDGFYHKINIPTLWNPSKKEFLGESSSFRILNNASDIIDKENRLSGDYSGNRSATLIGDPVLDEKDDRFGPLPGTRNEINDIETRLRTNGWSTSTYVAEDATKVNINNMDPGGIVHFATHGYFSTQEMIGKETLPDVELFRSGLIVTAENSNEGDLFSAFEVAGLNMGETDLVVLSACETALGDLQNGDGVFGLQYAFMISGANTLLLSLWNVNDEITKEFMVTFYAKLLESGNKWEAYNASVDSIRKSYPHPKYWGAFIYLGE